MERGKHTEGKGQATHTRGKQNAEGELSNE